LSAQVRPSTSIIGLTVIMKFCEVCLQQIPNEEFEAHFEQCANKYSEWLDEEEFGISHRWDGWKLNLSWALILILFVIIPWYLIYKLI
jgi:hypothetical protein